MAKIKTGQGMTGLKAGNGGRVTGVGGMGTVGRAWGTCPLSAPPGEEGYLTPPPGRGWGS